MPKTVDLTGLTFNSLYVIEKTSQKIGSAYAYRCKCLVCGGETLTTSTKLKSGHTKSCGCLKYKGIQDFSQNERKHKLVGQVFEDLTVLKELPEREDGRVMWLCKCSCGNEIKVKSSYLTQNRKTHCGCKTTSSKGEYRIQELLQNKGIKFIKEYTFKDLVCNGKKLRYDFFVEDKYLIEFDGKQHYIEDTGYGADLVNIQKRDALKNEYAFKNNIPLIRIPYTHLNNLCLEDLLLNTSTFLLNRKEDL